MRYKKMTATKFYATDKKVAYLQYTGSARVFLMYEGDNDVVQVPIRKLTRQIATWAGSTPATRKKSQQIAKLLQKYKPQIMALWHDNPVGESKHDTLVNDYETVIFEKGGYYFHHKDGSTYVNDLEGDIIMSLYMSEGRDEMLKALGVRK
jgi:hypothetical protein